MVRCWFLLALFTALSADEVPVGVVSGRISDVQGKTFQLDTTAGKSFRCSFDQRTWFEQSRVRVDITSFTPTDLVEIIADRRLIDGTPCYVRTVRLAEPKPPAGRLAISSRAVTEHIIPRGDLTWSGIVSVCTEKALTLRTRTDGYKTFQLRRDTRYLEDGVLSTRDRLRVNGKIFVRAGRNLEGDIEVYQVIWGSVTPESTLSGQ